jgi:hypothetical protein
MTIRHLNDRHYGWKHMIDYETFWILTFSAVVLGSAILHCFRFPRTTPTLSRECDPRGLRLHPSDRINPASVSETGQPRPPSSDRSRRDRPCSLWRNKMRTQNIAAVVATVATLSIPPAQAQLHQPPAPPVPSQPSFPRDCPPSAGINGPSSNETTGSRSLSDQLSQSKGLICPPAGIDPGISVPPIGGGRTPVIPPPGTPGGDPSIQPK